MSIKNIWLMGMVLVIFNACGNKEYTKQESVFIVFKTPAFKHADLGFIYENKEALKVEIYGSGQAVMALELTQSSICMSLFECMNKHTFNETVLSKYYPEDVLDNIFRGEAIFDGLNRLKKRNGFTQNIVKMGKYNINYSVLNKQIIFHDTINDILIKVKRLDS